MNFLLLLLGSLCYCEVVPHYSFESKRKSNVAHHCVRSREFVIEANLVFMELLNQFSHDGKGVGVND